MRKITANFRWVAPILEFVNRTFETALAQWAGQPGFTALSPTCPANEGALTVAALDVKTKPNETGQITTDMLRNAEAERVAELCARLVGSFLVRDPTTNTMRPCRFGDIALLAPVGTDLWRFEEALEGRAIPVSTQAGKGFFGRQEVQDLVALTRALADGRDTLALGALLRGPLVGLSEAELLDIAEGLPADPARPDRLPTLELWTHLDGITHELARSVLEKLQSLGRQASSTTPYLLLCDAVGELDVRSQLRARFRTGAERAQANVDLFLEMARAYDVRGLRAFARDMSANWSEAVRQVEGRPDAEEHAVALMTIHAAKGLEWPIVIPINMTGTPKPEQGVVHDRRSRTFSICVLGVAPAGHADIADRNEAELAREHVRLWYVAATRARDLIVLPRHSAPLNRHCWSRLVDLRLASLAPIAPEQLPAAAATPAPAAENRQTRAVFAEEAQRIAAAVASIEWQRPSLDEVAAAPAEAQRVFAAPEAVEESAEPPPTQIAGSAVRGTILHKLIEEVLGGETMDDAAALERRARELMAQLAIEPHSDPTAGVAPKELALTVLRTLNLPEIAALRPRLAAEHTVYARTSGVKGETLVSGVADAVARNDREEIEVVIDWKSDVDPDPQTLAAYHGQLAAYQHSTGARAALLVLMSSGTVLRA